MDDLFLFKRNLLVLDIAQETKSLYLQDFLKEKIKEKKGLGRLAAVIGHRVYSAIDAICKTHLVQKQEETQFQKLFNRNVYTFPKATPMYFEFDDKQLDRMEKIIRQAKLLTETNYPEPYNNLYKKIKESGIDFSKLNTFLDPQTPITRERIENVLRCQKLAQDVAKFDKEIESKYGVALKKENLEKPEFAALRAEHEMLKKLIDNDKLALIRTAGKACLEKIEAQNAIHKPPTPEIGELLNKIVFEEVKQHPYSFPASFVEMVKILAPFSLEKLQAINAPLPQDPTERHEHLKLALNCLEMEPFLQRNLSTYKVEGLPHSTLVDFPKVAEIQTCGKTFIQKVPPLNTFPWGDDDRELCNKLAVRHTLIHREDYSPALVRLQTILVENDFPDEVCKRQNLSEEPQERLRELKACVLGAEIQHLLKELLPEERALIDYRYLENPIRIFHQFYPLHRLFVEKNGPVSIQNGEPIPEQKQLEAAFKMALQFFPGLPFDKQQDNLAMARIVQFLMCGVKVAEIPYPTTDACFTWKGFSERKETLPVTKFDNPWELMQKTSKSYQAPTNLQTQHQLADHYIKNRLEQALKDFPREKISIGDQTFSFTREKQEFEAFANTFREDFCKRLQDPEIFAKELQFYSSFADTFYLKKFLTTNGFADLFKSLDVITTIDREEISKTAVFTKEQLKQLKGSPRLLNALLRLHFIRMFLLTQQESFAFRPQHIDKRDLDVHVRLQRAFATPDEIVLAVPTKRSYNVKADQFTYQVEDPWFLIFDHYETLGIEGRPGYTMPILQTTRRWEIPLPTDSSGPHSTTTYFEHPRVSILAANHLDKIAEALM